MAYTAPVVTASTQTFANLQAAGFPAFIGGVQAAQTPGMSVNAVNLLHDLRLQTLAARPYERASDLVDDFLHGRPVPVAQVKTLIFDLQYAYAVIAQALGEIGALVDANQGTLKFQADSLMGKSIRTFP